MSIRNIRSALLLTVACFCSWNQLASSQSISSGVVISQVYGGGGNSGATLTHDFIEFFNRGSAPVDLAGWTVQYASASGITWDRTVLAGTIEPGQYYLVREAQGNAGSNSLPAADADGGINLSATSGKVALASNDQVLSGSAPGGPNIVDVIGYGSANFSEGNPAPALTNTMAALRLGSGCTDTGNNGADFVRVNPAPRNRQSARNPCSPLVSPPEISAAGVVHGASFLNGPVAAGTIISIFGSNLGPSSLRTLELTPDGQFITTTLASTRVLFDGVPAPLIFVREDQLSAIVPFAIAGRDSTDVRVEYDGRTSEAIVLAVADSFPGIFTVDASGTGQAAVLNQDFSVNGSGNPAPPGSIVQVFATGGGQTDPPGEDGRLLIGSVPALPLAVSVEIDGHASDVLYAGPAPGLVSGVLQVNARVPAAARPGPVSLRVTVGEHSSQPGVTIAVTGSAPGPGSGAAIDGKLEQLRVDPAAVIAEIPSDFSPAPDGWLILVSWNIQVGGTSTSPGAERPPMVQGALSRLFSGSFPVLAAQEIPNSSSADLLRNLLPGGAPRWSMAFFDTTDAQDNGLWFSNEVRLTAAAPLFASPQTDGSGRLVSNPLRAVHPPIAAHLTLGDFDFTLISVHLTFADGNTAESARELGILLDYLDDYFLQPVHDPDVIVCGDFNMPSRLSGQTGSAGITVDSILDGDPRFQQGERRLVALVHEPTSRRPAASGGDPANNYDHCIVSADVMEELVGARRVDPRILTDDPSDPAVRLTSDHFPIAAFFRTRGPGVVRDL